MGERSQIPAGGTSLGETTARNVSRKQVLRAGRTPRAITARGCTNRSTSLQQCFSKMLPQPPEKPRLASQRLTPPAKSHARSQTLQPRGAARGWLTPRRKTSAKRSDAAGAPPKGTAASCGCGDPQQIFFRNLRYYLDILLR